MEDKYPRPHLSILAKEARNQVIKSWLQKKDFFGFKNDLPQNVVLTLEASFGLFPVEKWDNVVKCLVRHQYGTDNLESLKKKGFNQFNTNPFPITKSAVVEAVDKDDPREVGLRGGKKVLATRFLRNNEIIGIYEGFEVMEYEHAKDINILSEFYLEYKSISARPEIDVYKIPIDVFRSSGVRIPERKGNKNISIVNENDFVNFYCELVVDGSSNSGYFSWCSEINDFRLNPLEALNQPPLKKQLQNVRRPNVVFREVKILGWPVIFIVTTRTIQVGEELLIDYGLDDYWESMQRILKDHAIAKSIPQSIHPNFSAMALKLQELAKNFNFRQNEETNEKIKTIDLSDFYNDVDRLNLFLEKHFEINDSLENVHRSHYNSITGANNKQEEELFEDDDDFSVILDQYNNVNHCLSILVECIFYQLIRINYTEEFWRHFLGYDNYDITQDKFCKISPYWSNRITMYTSKNNPLAALFFKLESGHFTIEKVPAEISNSLESKHSRKELLVKAYLNIVDAINHPILLQNALSFSKEIVNSVPETILKSFNEYFFKCFGFCQTCSEVIFIPNTKILEHDLSLEQFFDDVCRCFNCKQKLPRNLTENNFNELNLLCKRYKLRPTLSNTKFTTKKTISAGSEKKVIEAPNMKKSNSINKIMVENIKKKNNANLNTITNEENVPHKIPEEEILINNIFETIVNDDFDKTSCRPIHLTNDEVNDFYQKILEPRFHTFNDFLEQAIISVKNSMLRNRSDILKKLNRIRIFKDLQLKALSEEVKMFYCRASDIEEMQNNLQANKRIPQLEGISSMQNSEKPPFNSSLRNIATPLLKKNEENQLESFTELTQDRKTTLEYSAVDDVRTDDRKDFFENQIETYKIMFFEELLPKHKDIYFAIKILSNFPHDPIALEKKRKLNTMLKFINTQLNSFNEGDSRTDYYMTLKNLCRMVCIPSESLFRLYFKIDNAKKDIDYVSNFYDNRNIDFANVISYCDGKKIKYTGGGSLEEKSAIKDTSCQNRRWKSMEKGVKVNITVSNKSKHPNKFFGTTVNPNKEKIKTIEPKNELLALLESILLRCCRLESEYLYIENGNKYTFKDSLSKKKKVCQAFSDITLKFDKEYPEDELCILFDFPLCLDPLNENLHHNEEQYSFGDLSRTVKRVKNPQLQSKEPFKADADFPKNYNGTEYSTIQDNKCGGNDVIDLTCSDIEVGKNHPKKILAGKLVMEVENSLLTSSSRKEIKYFKTSKRKFGQHSNLYIDPDLHPLFKRYKE
ncbi:hypothetical protein HK099_002564 [Clydaea vesicula]|uniref:SET domain-containing protein n=1 Tax=Clydaea vesicula TaxID=447962 RepID=A0AAD5U435_9FUNG|nr:hypothetical protein HK099_002564 [Clydaea vesicula]